MEKVTVWNLFLFRMYKARKSYSTEIRKNRDELDQYTEDDLKAKQKVQE